MINIIALPSLPSTLLSFLSCSANSLSCPIPTSWLTWTQLPLMTAVKVTFESHFSCSTLSLIPCPEYGKNISPPFTGPFALPAPILPSQLPCWNDSSQCHTLLHHSRFLERSQPVHVSLTEPISVQTAAFLTGSPLGPTDGLQVVALNLCRRRCLSHHTKGFLKTGDQCVCPLAWETWHGKRRTECTLWRIVGSQWILWTVLAECEHVCTFATCTYVWRN